MAGTYACEVTSIGSWVASNRQRLGLRQEELAEQVGVGQQAVSAWERHKTEPAGDVLGRLENLFGEAAPQRRHLRALGSPSEDEMDESLQVFTRQRFALELLEPRVQLGPMSDAEVALMRDAAREIYGFDLGRSWEAETTLHADASTFEDRTAPAG